MVSNTPPAPVPPSSAFLIRQFSKPKLGFENEKNKVKPEHIGEWNRVFGSKLVKGERLLQVFRGAIAKPTLLEGKIYISDYHFAFRLNWPGQFTLIFEWASVVDIRKAAFASVVKNALEIETTGETYFFGSLIGRGEKYDFLRSIWKEHVSEWSLLRKENQAGYKLNLNESSSSQATSRSVSPFQSSTTRTKNNTEEETSNNTPPEFVFKVDAPEVSEAIQPVDIPIIVTQSPAAQENIPDIVINDSSDAVEVPKAPPANLDSNDSDNNPFTNVPCSCDADPSYTPVTSSTVPISLEKIWNEWFTNPPEGTCFIRFLLSNQGITALEMAPWAEAGDPRGKETVPLDMITCINSTSNWCPKLDEIKTGMYKKTSRIIPLKHGIPFVPKSTPGENTFTVISVDQEKGNVCIRNEASILLMGIVTDLKICLKSVSEKETKISVYVNVIFTGKGKINVPKTLAEKGTLDGVKAFYSELCAYFVENISTSLEDVGDCSCECTAIEEGMELLYRSEFLPISIDDVWEQVFDRRSGNIFNRYATTRAGWQNLKQGPWRTKAEVTKPQQEYDTIAFKNLENGMNQETKYSHQNTDPFPNVPSSFPASAVITIEGAHHPYKLCLSQTTTISDLGLEGSFRMCINSLGPLKTTVLIMGSVLDTETSVLGGPVIVPEKWKIENVMTRVFKPFYTQLFGQYLIAKLATMKPKAAATRPKMESLNLLNRVNNILTLKNVTWRQSMEMMTIFLFFIVMIQSMIIMNLQMTVSNWSKTVKRLELIPSSTADNIDFSQE